MHCVKLTHIANFTLISNIHTYENKNFTRDIMSNRANTHTFSLSLPFSMRGITSYVLNN